MTDYCRPFSKRSQRVLLAFLIISIAAVFELAMYRRHEVYCPLGSMSTQHIMLSQYLKLDNDNQPEFIEIRRDNYDANSIFSPETPYLLVFNAERVDMINHLRGVEFHIYRDSLAATPDSTLVRDVVRDTRCLSITM